jgi:hypothetical protein
MMFISQKKQTVHVRNWQLIQNQTHFATWVRAYKLMENQLHV